MIKRTNMLYVLWHVDRLTRAFEELTRAGELSSAAYKELARTLQATKRLDHAWRVQRWKRLQISRGARYR